MSKSLFSNFHKLPPTSLLAVFAAAISSLMFSCKASIDANVTMTENPAKTTDDSTEQNSPVVDESTKYTAWVDSLDAVAWSPAKAAGGTESQPVIKISIALPISTVSGADISCEVSNLKGLEVTSPCACTLAECSFTAQPALDYNGEAQYQAQVIVDKTIVSQHQVNSFKIALPPIASGVSNIVSNEDEAFHLQLPYVDRNNLLAKACSVSDLNRVSQVNPCSCDTAGQCQIELRGEADYHGVASLNYTVTNSEDKVSPAANATLTLQNTSEEITIDLVGDLALTFSTQQVRPSATCYRLQGQVPVWNSDITTLGNFLGGVVGDFNNDSHLDVAIDDNGSLMKMLLGNGDGTFTVSSFAPIGASFRMSAGDFNEDGKLDFSTGNSTTIYFGNGDGTFPTNLDFANGSRWTEIGDIDADGHLDLVSVDYAKNVIVTYFGNGDGTFDPAHDSIHPTTALFSPSAIGWGFRAKLGDLNNDGKLDLFLPGNSNWASSWLGDGAGNFLFHQDFYDDLINSVDIFDIDHDGDNDIIISAGTSADRSSKIYSNDGQPTPTFSATWTDPNVHSSRSGVVADFNDDGLLDLIVGTRLQGYHLNTGTSDYKFSNAATLVSKTAGEYGYEMVKGDFNEDGIPDFIAGIYAAQLHLSSYFSSGTLTSAAVDLSTIQPEKGSLSKYKTLQVSTQTPGDSSLTYTLLDSSSTPITGFIDMTPDINGHIDISALPVSTIGFKVLVNFNKATSQNLSPRICGFSLVFERL